MRILVQECLEAKVVVEGKTVGEINRGEVLFVGFTSGDDENTISFMIDKLLKLRIFPDASGKTNCNLSQVSGSVLAISQFTLYADVRHGNRPSFVSALPSSESEKLYDRFKAMLLERVPDAQFGIFGDDMTVHMINDGPFTILLDSKELMKHE